MSAAGHDRARRRCGASAGSRERKLAFPELVLDNGSGLSRHERIAAQQHGQPAARSRTRATCASDYVSSLAVSATDGTVRKRFETRSVADQAFLKTGTLEGVRAITGYVLGPGGRRFVVVRFVNHLNAARAQPALDLLVERVYALAAAVPRAERVARSGGDRLVRDVEAFAPTCYSWLQPPAGRGDGTQFSGQFLSCRTMSDLRLLRPLPASGCVERSRGSRNHPRLRRDRLPRAAAAAQTRPRGPTAAALERKVAIERLKINPFALSATLSDVSIGERAKVRRCSPSPSSVNAEATSLLRWALGHRRAHAHPPGGAPGTQHRPELQRFRPDRAGARGTAGAATALSISNIQVLDGTIEFDDRPERQQHKVCRAGDRHLRSCPASRRRPKSRSTLTFFGAGQRTAHVGITGETRPFKDTHETVLHWDLSGLVSAACPWNMCR